MIKIYDTLTQKKQDLRPLEKNKVNLYVCGITVYDYCHVGHARLLIVFDMVVRYLRARGYQVTYVRNITDIDDKIILRAKENNESFSALAQRFIDASHDDERALNVLPPDHEPRASTSIDDIIALIEKLIAKDVAYVADNGDVCYAVKQFAEYGKLSKQDLSALHAGERVAVDAGKRDPLDFVLWKRAKADEPSWPSPWGTGAPGLAYRMFGDVDGVFGRKF